MSSTKRLSAFSVYQQIKRDEVTDECCASEKPPSISSETYTKSARKRKREFAFEGKKKRRVDKNSDENIGSQQKVKPKEKRLKKANVRGLSKKKQRKSIAVPPKIIERSSSDTEELSIGNGHDDRYHSPTDSDEECLTSDGTGISVPFYAQFDPDAFKDSRDAARELFRLLINPVPLKQFYNQVWESKPLVVHRHKEDYNYGWFNTQELDTILRENDLEFGTNIDITTYEDGERLTHNSDGRAHPSTVWEFFEAGCSVRLLNPATYSQSVWLLNSTLQEHFNSCVGANVYLTPANSQGFAPHFDDIEAFVLQLEGRKHWRVYAPRDTENMLPLYSSENFSEDDDLGQLVVDTVLEPGDLLYFPRGFIHQANTLPDSHSLHITLSTYQKNTWGTLLEKLLPTALQAATTSDVEFRQGLPLDTLNFMGVVNSDKDDPRRKEFSEKIADLMLKLIDYAPVDAGVDEVGVDHIHSSLPPVLTEGEIISSAAGLGAKWTSDGVVEGITVTPDTEVKLIRHGAVRLAIEGEANMLYYTLQNSKLYREKDVIGMQVHNDDALAIECLINTYPEFIGVDELPIGDGSSEDKVNLCQNLFSQGLLLIK